MGTQKGIDDIRVLIEKRPTHNDIGRDKFTIGPAGAFIEKDLRAQYLIGFTPTGHGAVKYREISLKLAGRIRSVRVRAGYLGTEPPLIASKHNERKRS